MPLIVREMLAKAFCPKCHDNNPDYSNHCERCFRTLGLTCVGDAVDHKPPALDDRMLPENKGGNNAEPDMESRENKRQAGHDVGGST